MATNDLSRIAYFILVCSIFIVVLRSLDSWLSRLLKLDQRLDVNRTLHETLQAARQQLDLAGIMEVFEKILKQWGEMKGDRVRALRKYQEGDDG